MYVYYALCKIPGNPPPPGTSTCQLAVNRIMRIRANGDVAVGLSATIVLDDIASDAGNSSSAILC